MLRDCKHFVKVGSGARLGELPSPPGTLRLLCHLELGEAAAVDAAGERCAARAAVRCCALLCLDVPCRAVRCGVPTLATAMLAALVAGMRAA